MAQPASPPQDFRSLLERGFALHQKSDYAAALPLLQQACKLQPHDYFANLLVGIELLRSDQPMQSLSYLREASRQRPNEDFPYDYMGEAQTRLGHYPEAAAAYEHALAVAPTSSQAIEGAVGYWVERFRALAEQLRSTNQGLAAEHRLQARAHPVVDPERQQLLAQSAALDPAEPGIWSELALANLAAGNTADAEAHLARAEAANPADLGVLQVQAMLAARRGDWVAAEHSLQAISEASPATMKRVADDWPQNLAPVNVSANPVLQALMRCKEDQRPCVLHAQAEAASHNGLKGAEPIAQLYREQRWERIAARPEPAGAGADVWLYRGAALANLGRCSTALAALEHAAAGISNKVFAEFLLSWCYAQEAERVARQLPQGEGESAALTHMVRGDVLLRMRADSAAAAAEYSAALQAHPDDPELLERLAEAQYEHGDFDEAVHNAEASLQIDPYRASAMQTLAHIAVQQRRYADAIPYLRKVVARDPRNASAQAELGSALAQTGNAAEAVEHLLPVLRAGYPDEKGSLHSVLGAALRKLGRNGEAQEAFAKARELSDAYQRKGHQGGNDAR